jgi:hypothetical protein
MKSQQKKATKNSIYVNITYLDLKVKNKDAEE